MGWYREFISQDYGRTVYKHKSLPLYITDEFNFYRCLSFRKDFYGKTASALFNGNLRYVEGRFASIFPGQKLSYWADSPQTARAEIKKHGAGNDILTFWAYDDATSTIPIYEEREPLIIVDARSHGLQSMFDRLDKGEEASKEDREKLAEIMSYSPDCLVYDSRARKGGENYLFFEKGFRKLALRELRLRFGREHGGSQSIIPCAMFSDYLPYLENYGLYFQEKAKIKMDDSYLHSEEYYNRKKTYENNSSKLNKVF